MDNVVFEYNTETPVCDCGTIATLETCKERANPGRRYWKCPQDRELCDYDRFLGWRNPAMVGRARDVINQLSSSRKLLREEVLPDLLKSNLQHGKNNQQLRAEMKQEAKEHSRFVKLLVCWIALLVVLISGLVGYIIK